MKKITLYFSLNQCIIVLENLLHIIKGNRVKKMENNSTKLIKILNHIPDIRQQSKVLHSLVDIIFIAIVASIAGADDWVCMQIFAEDHVEWFKKYIPLTNGVPSHDTIERVFKQIDPKIFMKCFLYSPLTNLEKIFVYDSIKTGG